MYQAITTRFLRPTSFRGARVRAKAAATTIIVSWDYSLNEPENHTVAAKQLAELMGWAGLWVGGSLPSEDGYAFVTRLNNTSLDQSDGCFTVG